MEKDFFISVALKAEEQDGSKYVYGVASDTSPDLQGDVVTQSAIMQMAKDAVGKPFLDEHDTKSWRGELGTIVEADVLDIDKGQPKLYIKAKLDDTYKAQDFYRAVRNPKRKIGMSIGGKVVNKGVLDSGEKKYRTLEGVSLSEISATCNPANPTTWLETIAKSVGQEQADMAKAKIDAMKNEKGWFSLIMDSLVTDETIMKSESVRVGTGEVVALSDSEEQHLFSSFAKKLEVNNNKEIVSMQKTEEIKKDGEEKVETPVPTPTPEQPPQPTPDVTPAETPKPETPAETPEAPATDAPAPEKVEEKPAEEPKAEEVKNEETIKSVLGVIMKGLDETLASNELTATEAKEVLRQIGTKIGEDLAGVIDVEKTVVVPKSFVEDVQEALIKSNEEIEELHKELTLYKGGKMPKEDMDTEEEEGEEPEIPMPTKKPFKKSTDKVSDFLTKFYSELQAPEGVAEEQVTKSVEPKVDVEAIIEKTVSKITEKFASKIEEVEKKVTEMGTQEVARKEQVLMTPDMFEKALKPDLFTSENVTKEEQPKSEEDAFSSLAKSLKTARNQ